MKKLVTLILSALACACMAIGFAACGGGGDDTPPSTSIPQDSSSVNGGDSTQQPDDSSDNQTEYDSTEGLEYTLSDDGTYYICSGIGTATGETIVIGSQYNDLPVKEIKSEAFTYNNNIKNVTIPHSIEKIGKNAFNGCNVLNYNYSNGGLYLGNNENKYYAFIKLSDSTLKSFTMENDCRVVEDCSLQNKTELLNIKLSKKLYSVSNSIFEGCISVTEISVPCNSEVAQISHFNYEKYFGKTNLSNFQKLIIYGKKQDSYFSKAERKMVFGDNYTSTFEYTNYTKNLDIKEIVIGDSIENIGNYIFAGWENLVKVTIGNSVTSIGQGAFTSCKKLASITIPDSVTEILGLAFDGSGLTSIVIPDSVTGMGGDAFRNCDSLTRVTIGNGLKHLPDYSFMWCDNLTSVTIGNSVTSIGKEAFFDCGRLANVIIPDSVRSIDFRAFAGCSSLTSITIPDSVNTIGDRAFTGCDSLREITLPFIGETRYGTEDKHFGYIFGAYSASYNSDYVPETLKTVNVSGGTIGERAFYNCDSLTGIKIGDNVTTIGKDAFYNCDSLTSVYITDITAWYAIDFGSQYSNPLCYAKNLYLNNQLVTELIIPDGVTEIKDYAFRNCDSLTRVTIPDSVTSIGEDAFYSCDSLTSVYITDITAWYAIDFDSLYSNPLCCAKNLYLNNQLVTELVIPDGVTEIKNYAFSGCSSLASIVIPNSITEIGRSAFYNCNSLTSITIPDSVTSIGNSAFYDCDSLTSVTIGNGVTSIDVYAFSDCDSLTGVYITDIAAWYAIDFADQSSNPLDYAKNLYLNNQLVTDLIIPDGVTEIKDYAFSGCDSLTSITIPDSVTSIGDDAFYDCDSLTSITIPDSVTSIGSYAFSGCSSLTSITIPDSVTSIGSYAFSGCSSLTRITIPDSVTSISNYAFRNCDSLTSVTIGNGVTSIGDDAFYDCDSLTSITIPDSVTSIGSYAFSSCDSLTSVTIPDSVTSIGDRAFFSCNSLTSIVYKGTMEEWKAISKGSDWNSYTGTYTVTCTDGVLSKSES